MKRMETAAGGISGTEGQFFSLVLIALLHADEGKLLKFSGINTLKSVVVLHLDQVRNQHLSGWIRLLT